MPPVTLRSGRFHLDQIEKDKLYLTWLSCHEFEKLCKSHNKTMLMSVWASIKSDLQRCFANYCVSLESIANNFKKMVLTSDPCLSCGYDPEENALKFNLLSLFFSLSQDKFAIPTLACITGSQLVHEFDHYLFLKERNMIGKKENDYAEFNKVHLAELEKRAFVAQQDFLENSKNNYPTETLTYGIKIKKWSLNGIVLDSESLGISIRRDGAIQIISDLIRQISQVIEKIEAGENYDTLSLHNSSEKNSEIAAILSLPISHKDGKDHPKIEIEM